MTDRQTPYLQATGLTAGYGKVPIVRDVTVQVGLGEIVVVVGPNGAGKSTLVKAITGELDALAGTVRLGETDMTSMREDDRMRHGMGYVPQLHDVFPTLTVQENLEMGGYRLSKKETAERIDLALESFPALQPLRRRVARSMSGGEQKMLGVARALMADPKLLILDEPTANLSPQVAAHVLNDIVASLAKDGRAILLIEQRVAMALEIAKWGYVLTDGQVRLNQSATELAQMTDLGSLFLGMSKENAARVAE